MTAADYDGGAAGYDERFRADPRTPRRYAIVEAPALAIARGRVLELGCGTGRLLASARAPVRVGIDVAPAMLARAAARGLTVARADAHALPFGSGSFDAILAGNAVFGHLDARRAFAECARVLAPGGRIAVHQLAARPFSLRRPRAAPGLLGDLEELRGPARAAGLVEKELHLFRGLPVWPYAVRVPAWVGRLWTHVVILFG